MAVLSKEAKESRLRREGQTTLLHSLGLEGYLIPRKHKKMSYTGVMITDKTTWDKGKINPFTSEALSVYMGKEFVSVDIDKPEKLCRELRDILKKYSTLMIWHGDTKPLEGGKGSFIFKTSFTHPKYPLYKRLIVRTDKRLNTHGYEILRGNTSQMIYGLHHGREWYQHNEVSPIQLPEELFEYLRKNDELFKRRRRSKTKAILSQNPVRLQKFLEDVEDVFNNRGMFLETLDYAEKLNSDLCLLKIVGRDTEAHSFVLYINEDGSCVVTTNQSNFRSKLPSQKAFSGLKLPIKLRRRKKDISPTQERKAELNPANTEDLKEMMGWGKIIGVSASTGTGKSYNSRETILEWLFDDKKHKALYVTSDNKNARAMALMFDDHSEIFTLNAQTSGGWKEEKENIRLVITNQHYLTRKGITDQNHYAVLAWVDPYTLVIIDEADMLYNKMKFEQPLKFRFSERSQETGDEFDYLKPYHVCKSSAADGFHCTDCTLSNRMAVRMNTHLKRKEYTDQKITVGALKSDVGWSDLFGWLKTSKAVGEEVPLHSSMKLDLSAHKIDMLDQSYLNRRKVTFNADVTPFESLGDLLRCSHDAFLMINNFDEELVKAKREELLESHLDKTNPSRYANRDLKKWMHENELNFPYAVCNVPVLKCFDMSSLRRLANTAARVVLLSATYSRQQIEYFEAALPGIIWLEYSGKTYKAIDSLLVITIEEQMSRGNFKFLMNVQKENNTRESILEIVTKTAPEYLEKIGEEDGHDIFAGRTLLVQPFSDFGIDSDSRGVFNRTENRIDRFASDGFVSSNTNSRVVPTTVTYSRSALARGMNLGDYDRVITEGEAYQPADSYHWQSNGENNLSELQTNEKVRLLMQSVGRIMRAPTIFEDGHNKQIDKLRIKCITIYNAGEKFGEKVAEILSPLCEKTAQSFHISASFSDDSIFPPLCTSDAILRALKIESHWLKNGRLKRSLITPEYRKKDDRINRPWSTISSEVKKRFGTLENLNRTKEAL